MPNQKLRCRVGDTALTNSTDVNRGARGTLVRVVARWRGEPLGEDRQFIDDGQPAWVVESLGSPIEDLTPDFKPSGKFYLVSVFDDDALIPLRRGRGTDEMLRLAGKPVEPPRMTVSGARAPMPGETR